MHVLTVLCAGGWMPGNLSEGWRRLGCEVHEYLYGTHMGRDWSREGGSRNAAVNEELLSMARRLRSEGRLNLIFAVIYDDVLEAGTAKALRNLGAPMVNYHVDLTGQWYRVLQTGKYFDRLACAQEVHWSGLTRAGIRPYLMPMAANLPLKEERPAPDTVFEGVVYAGSPWTDRRVVLAGLVRQGIPLQVYGHNWSDDGRIRNSANPPQAVRKRLHDLCHYLVPRLQEEGVEGLANALHERMAATRDPVIAAAVLPPSVLRGSYAAEQFPSLVRGAAVNLGFTRAGGRAGARTERRQVRLREFEIPMLGGFYLTQRCAELSSFYTEDEHIACWDGTGELREKIRYYLERPAERNRISEAGQRHAATFHTWETRFRGLLHELGLRSPSASR